MSSSRKTSRLLELAKEIVRSENQLDLLRQEFARLAGESSDAGNENERVPAPRPPLARTSSYTERVQSVLDLSPRGLTVPEIATMLEGPRSLDSIRAALSKLVGRGTVAREATGIYRSVRSGHRAASGEDD